MELLKKPKALSPGDTIGIVSPSWCGAALFPHRVQKGVKTLEGLGYKVVLGEHTLKKTGYTAGSPKERAADINAFFEDKKIKAIIATIGGNHSNQVLPYLKWDMIERRRKIFIGFSDITVLHLAIYTKTGLVTFYGPSLLNQFADNLDVSDYSIEHFNRSLTQTTPIGEIRPAKTWTDDVLDWSKKLDIKKKRSMRKNLGWKWLKKGQCEGRLVGGCISSLIHLRGTNFWPPFKNTIFFWEIPEGNSIFEGENLATIDAYLTDLKLSGVFKSIVGMIVGRPYRYTESDTDALEKLILEQTREYRFPILFNVDIGHTDPIITVPIGVMAKLDSNGNSFFITEAGVALDNT